MPKGARRKGRSDRWRNDVSAQNSDDDSNDNMSIMSNHSEASRIDDIDETEETAQENFEDKLLEVLEGLTQKSAQGRINCLQSFYKALVKKYIPNFVRERHFTISDSIERCLKKGGDQEKAAAADLVPLICLQLGLEDTTEEFSRLLKPMLVTMAMDNTLSALVRARCCLAVSSMTFFAGGEMGDVVTLMQQLESVFSGSYLKGDKSVPTISPETANLHTAALSGWTLLFTLMTAADVSSMLNTKGFPSLDRLSELFASAHLDVRLTAGEALAVIYELGREEDDAFAEDCTDDILENLKQLATESHKYRAKKDRKQQRATFRDIRVYIEEDLVPEVKLKFGTELLTLDTWVKRKQYDTICAILGPGINVHLSENDLLKEILEIVTPSVVYTSECTLKQQSAEERQQRRQMNAANFKARTIARGKHRDKRSDF